MARLGWSVYRDFGQTHTTNHFSRIPDALDVCVRHSNLETHEQTATGKVHKIPAAGIETSTRVNSHLSVIGTNWWYQSAVLLARTSRDMLWRIWSNMVRGAWKSCPRMARHELGSVLDKIDAKWWGQSGAIIFFKNIQKWPELTKRRYLPSGKPKDWWWTIRGKGWNTICKLKVPHVSSWTAASVL